MKRDADATKRDARPGIRPESGLPHYGRRHWTAGPAGLLPAGSPRIDAADPRRREDADPVAGLRPGAVPAGAGAAVPGSAAARARLPRVGYGPRAADRSGLPRRSARPRLRPSPRPGGRRGARAGVGGPGPGRGRRRPPLVQPRAVAHVGPGGDRTGRPRAPPLG